MGIANTTPSAALIAAFTGADPAAATGRGTGIDDETLRAARSAWSRAGAGPARGPTRPTRSGCWPRSAAWSTPRSPASSSAPPPAGYR